MSDTKQATLHVLAVGVGGYAKESGFGVLSYAVPSAKAIESLFMRQQANPKSPYKSVRVWGGLYDQDVTRDSLRKRLVEMARSSGPDDVLFLYFVGHGIVSKEMYYFVPANGRDVDLRETAFSTADLAEALRYLPPRRIVLVVDSCQSGGAIEALGKVGVAKANAEEIRAMIDPPGAGRDHGVGIHIIAATLPLSYAIGLVGGRSALANTLLEALQPTDGLIMTKQFEQHVMDRLKVFSRVATPGFDQVPLVVSIGLNFALIGN